MVESNEHVRANHVGSLLRPPELRQAREKREKGDISARAVAGGRRIAAFATR